MTFPSLTLSEAIAIVCTYPQIKRPGDREMLEVAARVVGGSADGTRERFREAAEGASPFAKFSHSLCNDLAGGGQ
jgi:hypothetical protein